MSKIAYLNERQQQLEHVFEKLDEFKGRISSITVCLVLNKEDNEHVIWSTEVPDKIKMVGLLEVAKHRTLKEL